MMHLPECTYGMTRARAVLRGGESIRITSPTPARLRYVYDDIETLRPPAFEPKEPQP